MNELVFITSSRVKLVHARYLCRDYNLKIIPHKKLHYGVGYEEPRIFEREKLLKASVEDAISRIKRNISTSEKRLFILEDTSVKIHALSTQDFEVPGVDIKYWMQETSFNEVDLLLKNAGNNRLATVFSHLVLILSKELKNIYNSDYIIFSSQTEGYVTENEFSFETNKVFPWLDNKTFNKWFIPNGEKVPISILPIETASIYDFRAGAFTSMLNFLEENKKIHKKYALEITPRLAFNPIFIVSGPTNAGKSTIGRYLLDTYGFFHIEASDFMHIEFFETHGNNSSIDIGEFAKEVLKVKPYVVADRIINYLESIPKISSLIVTGFRTPEEIKYFQDFSPIRSDFIVIYVDANIETRFQRWTNRKRNDSCDRSKFETENKLQNEQGLTRIMQLDNTIKIFNDTSIINYFKLFKTRFLENVEPDLELDGINDINDSIRSLEDAIILTLAKEINNKNESFYTTTEISKMINRNFNAPSKLKHKDNVSRYFNQNYHAHFNVKVINGKIKYKLSNTGYSYSIVLQKKYSKYD